MKTQYDLIQQSIRNLIQRILNSKGSIYFLTNQDHDLFAMEEKIKSARILEKFSETLVGSNRR